jgi:hypothetical protein
MLEIGTSGTVRGEGGNILTYSAAALAPTLEASGGNDLGGKQTRRPEDYRMTAAALRDPALKSLSGMLW